jgi:hypothetical protein
MQIFGIAFGSLLGMLILLLVGYAIGKNYPGLFASIPVVNKVL